LARAGFVEELDDTELLRLVIGGSEPAARVFVLRFSPSVMRVLRGFHQFGRPEVEDLLQEVFLRIFARDCAALSRWRGMGPLAAYIGAIARNLARDRLQAMGTDPLSEPLDELDLMVDDAPSPEALARLNQLRRMMRTAIQQLGPPHTEVLNLVDLQELSYAGAGERLGRNANHIGVQVHEARQRLRALIARDYPALRDHLHALD
jgi:RNA polymerase sigma factor (sigma-70 family)